MFLATLLLSAVIAIQVPSVQTSVSRKFTDRLMEKFDGRIEYSGVALQPFNTLIISDLALIDKNPWNDGTRTAVDTVFRAGSVSARFNLAGLLSKNGIKIKKAEVSDAAMTLVAEPGEMYRNNISRVFHLVRKDREKSTKDIFSIRKVRLDDFRFIMVSYKPAKKERNSDFGINWKDLDLTADVEARNLRFSNSIMSGTADRIVLSEKSGYKAGLISGSAKVGRGRTELTDLRIKDQWTDADVPSFVMEYENTLSFKNFIHDVRLDASLNWSLLSLRTLSYFIPSLKDKTSVLEISSGNVAGFVDNLDISNLRFVERSSGVSGVINAAASGMPDMKSAGIKARLSDFNFTAVGFGELMKQFTGKRITALDGIAPGERFSFNGVAEGLLSNMVVSGSIHSGIGHMNADLDINGLGSGRPIGIEGDISTEDIDIGRFIGKDFIGECSLEASLKADLEKGAPSVRIDSLDVSRLNILGYDYSGIKAAGTFSQQAFDGRIICNDPNVNFMFQGLFNLSRRTNNALYRFYAYVGYADLHALNIDSREISKVSVGSINANYRRVVRGDLIGSIDASGIILESATGIHDIGDVRINSLNSNGRHDIRLSSAFADGTYSGTKDPGAFIKDIQDITTRKELTALFGVPQNKWDGSSYRAELNFHDSRDLLSFAAPGAYIADSTSVMLRVSENGRMTGRISSPRIAMKEKYIKGLSLEFDNRDDALNCTVTGAELKFAPALVFNDNAVMLYANDNSVGIGYNYNNRTEEENRGEFYITGNISGSSPGLPVINAKSLTSNIYMDGENWRIEPAEYEYSKDGAVIRGLRISNGDQLISVEGGISKDKADSLLLSLESVDLSLANNLVLKEIGIEGLASGRVLLTSPTKDGFGIAANLTSESTSFAGHPAGTLTAACMMEGGDDRLDFALRNSIGGISSIDTRGTYFLKENNLDIGASLDGFDFGYAAPFLESVFSDLEGRLSGRISASGPVDRLDVSSQDLTLKDGLLHIAFTNVPYHAEGPLHLDNTGLFFDGIAVTDDFKGSGSVNGGIRFNRFKDITMDTRIRMDNIQCLNTFEGDNSSFYGTVFGTGRMNITGPFNALLLDIEATTTREGRFHIPLNGAGATGPSDLLVFTEPERHVYVDPYEMMISTLGATDKQRNNMGIQLKVNATPAVEANLEVDKSTGNVLTGRGSGTISLDVRPSAESFSINGDYTLNSGNYHFSALGIANKDFSILDGSSIKFNGDIMDSDLDIDAQYLTKTSLSSLISDTTSVSTRRNVECGISISDKLRNPQLAFSINVPDLDPTTKSRVESALSTDDKVQKQFIALLVTNNFLPDDQSGIVNNSNILYSNVADIMANQLNNILQRLEIPLDLGLKYQESGSGTSIFDVALSTQLFNNRVIVNGNIGNRQHMSSGSEDVVGDLDIEIKMDRNGEVRLNLFSHAADAYTNYLDDSQRNGIGVAYQKEFNSVRQFIKSLFTPKSVRQARELEEASRDVEIITIDIGK